MQTFKDYLNSLRGKEVTVVGLGVSNRPLAALLLEAGAKVNVRDANENLDTSGLEGVSFTLGKDYLHNLSGDLIFRTPGLHPYSPAFLEAESRGSKITSEMEEFFALCPCPIIGITGSDGKTTTTSLIAEMLLAEGYNVHLGGNIGTPLLASLPDMKPRDHVVAELSSFQTISMTRSPQTAVITNITPNHLDWHLDMEEYIAAKRRIIDYQSSGDLAVLNSDNPITAKFLGLGRTIYFGKHRIKDGKIDGFLPLESIKLKGSYQVENMLAAISAVSDLVSKSAIKYVAETFSGVEHRNEHIATIGGVEYYNNSIGTSPARTIATLKAHGKPVYLICGGRDKGVPFDELCAMFPKHAKKVYLIGEAAAQIEQAAKNITNSPPLEHCFGLEDAVLKARKSAESGDVILLSPACTAFDSYKNFAERGEHFREIVEKLRSEV